MRSRPIFVILLLLIAGIGAAGWGWAWREHRALQQADFLHHRLEFLEADNRRLGNVLDAKQSAETLAVTAVKRTEIERTVAGLRDLSFLQPVRYREIPRSQLPEILRQKLVQQVPDQEFDHTGTALAALGLMPRGLDLKKTYLALLGEQIGAFYDQHTQELFTFAGQSLDNSQNRVILAHELTHALEDQHFKLSRLPLETKGNDDRALAASALVEGDATLVMNQYLAGNLSAAVLRDSLASTLTTDVRQLASAPRYLRETLLFPYLHGLAFCQALYEQGGWDALASAFAHPPASTADILHPRRYLSETSPPTVMIFDGTTVLGTSPVDDNVLGEFGIRQLLGAWLKDDQAAARTAEGWRGDRYLVYGDARACSYVWRTVWRDPASAGQFVDAMHRCQATRYPGSKFAGEGDGGNSLPLSLSSARDAHMVMIARPVATEVVVIDAQDGRWFSALQTQFLTGGLQP